MDGTFLTPFTQDGRIDVPQLKLHSVTLATDGSGNADLVVYQGKDAATGVPILSLRAVTKSSLQARFKGALIQDGLFVDIGSNVERVTVEWEKCD